MNLLPSQSDITTLVMFYVRSAKHLVIYPTVKYLWLYQYKNVEPKPKSASAGGGKRVGASPQSPAKQTAPPDVKPEQVNQETTSYDLALEENYRERLYIQVSMWINH